MANAAELSFHLYKTLAFDYFSFSLLNEDLGPILAAGEKLGIEQPLIDRAKKDFVKYGEIYLIEVGSKLYERFLEMKL